MVKFWLVLDISTCFLDVFSYAAQVLDINRCVTVWYVIDPGLWAGD